MCRPARLRTNRSTSASGYNSQLADCQDGWKFASSRLSFRTRGNLGPPRKSQRGDITILMTLGSGARLCLPLRWSEFTWLPPWQIPVSGHFTGDHSRSWRQPGDSHLAGWHPAVRDQRRWAILLRVRRDLAIHRHGHSSHVLLHTVLSLLSPLSAAQIEAAGKTSRPRTTILLLHLKSDRLRMNAVPMSSDPIIGPGRTSSSRHKAAVAAVCPLGAGRLNPRCRPHL